MLTEKNLNCMYAIKNFVNKLLFSTKMFTLFSMLMFLLNILRDLVVSVLRLNSHRNYIDEEKRGMVRLC